MSKLVLALMHCSNFKFLEIDLSEKRKINLLKHRGWRFSAERGKMGKNVRRSKRMVPAFTEE